MKKDKNEKEVKKESKEERKKENKEPTSQWRRISQTKDLQEDVLQNLDHSVESESAQEARAEIDRHACFSSRNGRKFAKKLVFEMLEKFFRKEDH